MNKLNLFLFKNRFGFKGSQINIDNALQMIREKFPLKRYPEVTLEQMPIHPPVALTPDQLHVNLT